MTATNDVRCDACGKIIPPIDKRIQIRIGIEPSLHAMMYGAKESKRVDFCCRECAARWVINESPDDILVIPREIVL